MEHIHGDLTTSTRGQKDTDSNNNDDALCPICLSEMNMVEDICACSSCNNHLHRHCMSVWSQECVAQRGPVQCPLCRSNWSQLPAHPVKQQKQASAYQYFVPPPYQSLSRQGGTPVSSGYSSWMSSVSRTSDTMHMIEQNGCPEDIPLPKVKLL